MIVGKYKFVIELQVSKHNVDSLTFSDMHETQQVDTTKFVFSDIKTSIDKCVDDVLSDARSVYYEGKYLPSQDGE